MMTKAEVDQVIDETKSLKARVEAAEARTKALEEEKADVLATKGYAPVVGRGSSDEQRALRAFGCSHPSQLLHVNVGAKKFANVPAELKHTVLNFKAAVDIGRWTAQMFHGGEMDAAPAASEARDRMVSVKGVLHTPYGKDILVPAIKAFGSTVANAGDEWVPTAVSSQYIEEYELERVLEGKFGQVNMPTNPFDMPKIKTVTKARIAAEGATKTGANFNTDKIRFTATKLVEYYELPEELTEDSAPDFLAAGRSEVVAAQSRAAESAILNGDNDGTHIDSDTQAGAADLAEKAFNGLRKLALANSATVDFGNVAVTEALLRDLRALMKKFGSNPKDCLIVAGPSVYIQLQALDSVTTLEKFGPMATVLSGALAAYQGIPIVNSEWMREDLSATGVYDGVTTDRAGIILVNTKRFYFGQRRPIRVKLMPSLPSSDQMLLASYRRVDFQGHAQSGTEKSVVYGINVNV